ncbi:hypothetical protein D9619_007290 [Psilocybe cf. subviscida]|uniref:Ubiquitin-like protease family profile domain-containing protein n=1 Tax=Psilocybe cf. subviscida TaxID=2480587 RepID=A0A8H5EWY3_9AGAR|nr:hypothetical protein D9619_007290 [Psilocybe cf. subviscida]
MATPSERKEIAKLQLPGDSVWKKHPTTISKPQNPARTAQPARTASGIASGSNPFGKPPQRAPAKGQRSSIGVGNPTSRQTLAGAHREPPNKRQKVSHGGGGFGGSLAMSKILGQAEAEVILVDDDPEEAQQKRSSKYLFRADSRRNGKQTIHPSGTNTAYLDNFKDVDIPTPQVEDLTMLSDDIESFSEDSPIPPSDPRLQGSRMSTGTVKQRVAEIEAKIPPSTTAPSTQAPKPSPKRLDLTTIVPVRGKKRMQKKKFEPMKSPGNPAAGPSTIPKNLDPIATSSSLKPTLRPPLKYLPVKEALIDALDYDGGKHGLFVACDSKKGLFLMKRQDDLAGTSNILFRIPPGDDPTLNFKYGTTILQFSNKSTEGLVTIRFHVGDPEWSVGKKDAVIAFMRGLKADLSTPNDEEMLWSAAQNHKAALLAEDPSIQEVEPKPDRMEELKVIEERKRKDSCRQLQSDKPQTIQAIFGVKHRESRANAASASPAVPSTALPANDRRPPTRSSKKNDPQIAEAPTLVRRSARNKERESEERAPDADEVMLVYPLGAPGAVTITKGDFARLEPGQYLNDTLIEFALKLWMTRLEQERPDIAQQVHVFSSFFYKKLNSKRDIRQAYENVRKWTSKFDIFKKKYIIVPINEHYHWYLAIIYEPEHMLSETTPEKPTARKATRLATKAVEAELADALVQSEETTNAMDESDGKPSVDVEEGQAVGQSAEKELSVSGDIPLISPQISSEGEVERDLSGFEESVRIEDPEPEEPSSKAAARSPSPATLSYVSYSAPDVSKSRAVSPSASDFGKTIPRSRRASNASSDVNMSDPDEMLLQDGDGPVEQLSEENVALLDRSDTDAAADPGSPIAVSEVASASHGGAIPPARFYQSVTKKGKGKQKAQPKRQVLSVDDDNTQDVEMDVDRKPRTVIFTLDSLGTSHRAAITKLSGYLQREAEDKKGITNAGQAEGKQASVPAQPNFCDCGLYLIHFAQTFISDPVKYYGLSMAPKGKLHNKDAKEDWNDKKVHTMRADLAQEITSRSEEWVKTRPAKPEKEENESDDDDVTILSQITGVKGKAAASQKSGVSQKPPVSKKPAVSQKSAVLQKPDVSQKPVEPTEPSNINQPRIAT